MEKKEIGKKVKTIAKFFCVKRKRKKTKTKTNTKKPPKNPKPLGETNHQRSQKENKQTANQPSP